MELYSLISAKRSAHQPGTEICEGWGNNHFPLMSGAKIYLAALIFFVAPHFFFFREIKLTESMLLRAQMMCCHLPGSMKQLLLWPQDALSLNDNTQLKHTTLVCSRASLLEEPWQSLICPAHSPTALWREKTWEVVCRGSRINDFTCKAECCYNFYLGRPYWAGFVR